MTQKERLVELLLRAGHDVSDVADYLLDNGVIVPPLVIGNILIPHESGFDYGTLKAFKTNDDARAYMQEQAEPTLVFDCYEEREK